jgi:hypothetical protein
MSNRRARGTGRTRGRGRASDRGRTADRCGDPSGCSRPALHEVVDPVYGGCWSACADHWPDLVAMLWAQGAWVSACPCRECITEGPQEGHHGRL